MDSMNSNDWKEFFVDGAILAQNLEKMIGKEVCDFIKDWGNKQSENSSLGDKDKYNDGDSKNDSESIYAEPESGAEDDDEFDDEKTVFVADDATDDKDKPFILTAFTGGVFYGDYVKSVSADYNAHELYVEIEDPTYAVIPELLDYWERLYDGTATPVEESVVVRDNGLTKTFETFKDCEIINIEISPYEDGEIKARKAILTYSYDRSVIERVNSHLDLEY